MLAVFAVFALAAAGTAGPAASAGPAPKPAPPALGVLVNLEASATPALRQSALEMVRRTGANFFVLELSWTAAEPSPHRYRVEEVTRAARVLRQSGAVLHLDLPLV